MKVCNRCRKEISCDPNANVEFPIVAMVMSVKRESFCSWEDVDLCDRCKKEFLTWIKKGKKDEE